MMKLTLILLLLFVLPCHRPALEVIDATSVQHLPGRKESPVVTQYDVTVVVRKNSDILVIGKIFIANTPCEVKVLDPASGKPVESFEKGDTLLLRASRYEKEENPSDATSLLPEAYAGEEMVIACRLRGKQVWFPVKEIRRMPGRTDL